MLTLLYRKKNDEHERLLTGFTNDPNLNELCTQLADLPDQSFKLSNDEELFYVLSNYNSSQEKA